MPPKPISRRRLLKLFGASIVAGFGGTIGPASYARWVEPGWFEVTRQQVALPQLAPALAGYRLVQLSDVHIDAETMDADRLAHVVDLTNALSADLIVITGDVFTADPTLIPPATWQHLQRLRAADGVVAVLGNHDYWGGAPAFVRSVLRDCGIRELPDTFISVQRQGHALHIAGLDDLWPIPELQPSAEQLRQRLARLVGAMPSADPAILLVHEPDIAALTAQTGRFGLQLSGHSHGGQVHAPFGGPLVLPPLGQRYPLGRYDLGALTHYTSRGLGMVKPFVRFNCRPELAVIELQPAG